MISPAGGIQVLDGLAALAGVSSRANAVRPGGQLTEQQQKELDELGTRDREVRVHEQAHKAAAGTHGGPISFSYTTGPDGKRYAVEGDPEATVRKMQQVRDAALAPADPSAADRQVAARAQRLEGEARTEQLQQEKDEPSEPGAMIDVLA